MRQEPIPPSLAAEGSLMLGALVGDLLAIAEPSIELSILHDDRLPSPRDERIQAVSIGEGDSFRAIWLDAIDRCDAAWVIAPETGGVLELLCRDVEAAGKPLLTCPSTAVELAASKLQTIRRLEKFGLPVAPTAALQQWQADFSQPFVIKPDDGAGCEGARIVRGMAGLPAKAEGWVAQSLLAGDSLSLSVLFAHGEARVLCGNVQLIERVDGGFALKGCRVNALADEDGGWQHLAAKIAQALPELWGYAGVDLVLTAAGPIILEINPRLTTSYAGISRALDANPAAWVLQLLETGKLPAPSAAKGKTVEILLDNNHGH